MTAELWNTLGGSDLVTVVALVLARVAPVVYLAPFLGGPALSSAVRFVVAVAITAALYPAAAVATVDTPEAGVFVLLLAKEVLIGVCLGLLASVAFHALSMAGQLVDISRGTAAGQVQNPFAGGESSPLASLHLLLAVVLFVVLGGHRAFLAALAGSFEVIPIGELPLAPAGVQGAALLAAELVGGAIAAALMLAGPAVAAVVLVDVTLGLLGRTAPQIGTYFMAMPLRAAAGLAMVLLTLAVVLPDIVLYLDGAVAVVGRVTALLSQEI